MSQYIQWPSTGGTLGTLTVGTIDSVAASVNGAVITSGVLYMQSASATVPGLMNTAAQTIAGSKTFTAALNVGTYPFISGSPYVRTTLTGAPGSSPGLEFYSGGGDNKIYQFFPDGDVGMSIYSASDGAAMARFYRTYAQILSVTAGELLLIESTGTTVANGLVTIGTAGSIQGKLKLNGATSGYTQIKASATAGSWDLTLPTSAGSAGQVLQTDGAGVTSWASAGGSGTVTSVAMTVPAFLSVSGSPITSSGTLAVSLSGTALPVINGGTGAVSLTSNELVVANGTSALSTISNPGAGRVLVSNTGAAPSFSSTPTLGVAGVTQGSLNIAGSTSGTVSVLVQNAAGTYNFNLPTAAGISGQPLLSGGGGATAMSFGVLGIGAGGTGQTTANAGFNALSPMTTAGDIIYGGASGAGTRLASNSTATNKFLRTVSSGNPSWEQVAASDLSGNLASSKVAGTTTNDSAASGILGEFGLVNSTGVSVAASGSWVNICSLSLTAGDWDVEGNFDFLPGTGTGITLLSAAISTTSSNTDSSANGGYLIYTDSAIGRTFFPVGKRRISLASTTTVYFVGNATYSSAGTAQWGTNSVMIARRVR